MYFDRNSIMEHCNGRKRPRSCEDDSCEELMPISKRINDLHIRSCCPDSSSMLTDCPIPEAQTRNRIAREAQDMNFPSMADMHRQNSIPKDNMLHYRPELSLTENPYYYHANEVLYEAHLQRQQRLTKPAV